MFSLQPHVRYRCTHCGNLTRFDVEVVRRTREYHHYDLGGEVTVEEVETLEEKRERVVCRWCGTSEHVEEVASPW
ncbi:MAG: hypothetical protein KatS3mg008_0034 [Acidimicrobiales bacterium]|nr:MAG: hypothetical protein KatS3mg008_0034 [Acidimicrobiales bacterium]